MTVWNKELSPVSLILTFFVQKNLFFPTAWATHAYLERKRFGNEYESTLPPPPQSKLQTLRNDVLIPRDVSPMGLYEPPWGCRKDIESPQSSFCTTLGLLDGSHVYLPR
jgi:hypothetical protein